MGKWKGIWTQKHGNIKDEPAVRPSLVVGGGNEREEGEEISTNSWLAQYRGTQVVSKNLCR